MLRYIRCSNAWIDTLTELRDNHDAYIIVDGLVIRIDESGIETVLGKLEGESDEIQSLC